MPSVSKTESLNPRWNKKTQTHQINHQKKQAKAQQNSPTQIDAPALNFKLNPTTLFIISLWMSPVGKNPLVAQARPTSRKLATAALNSADKTTSLRAHTQQTTLSSPHHPFAPHNASITSALKASIKLNEYIISTNRPIQRDIHASTAQKIPIVASAKKIRQTRQTNQNEIPSDHSPIHCPTPSSIRLNSATLNIEKNINRSPSINSAIIDQVISNTGRINFDGFIAWYTKIHGAPHLNDSDQKLLETLTHIFNTHPEPDNKLARLAYVTDIAKQILNSPVEPSSNTATPTDTESGIHTEIMQTWRTTLNHDPLILWRDTQQWPDIVQLSGQGETTTQADHAHLNLILQEYRCLLEEGYDGLSGPEHHLLHELGATWPARVTATLIESSQLINQETQRFAATIGLNSNEKDFLKLTPLTLQLIPSDEDDFRAPDIQKNGPLVLVSATAPNNQEDASARFALFAHAIKKNWGASYVIERNTPFALRLQPLNPQTKSYSIFLGDKAISYENTFNTLHILSLYLDDLTLSQALYKLLHTARLDHDFINRIKHSGITRHLDIKDISHHLYAWLLHITVCQEQTIPGTQVRIKRLLADLIQKPDADLLTFEDKSGTLRRLTLTQILNPISPFFSALDGQNQEKKDLYNDIHRAAHCTCEVTESPRTRLIRSPQNTSNTHKTINCTAFTQNLAQALLTHTPYISIRDSMPRQEAESILRYGIDYISRIRALPDGEEKTALIQEALVETKKQLEIFKHELYEPYKTLRNKQKKGLLTAQEEAIFKTYRDTMANNHGEKINKVIDLLNEDFQTAYEKAKENTPTVQRNDFPQLQHIQVSAVIDTRVSGTTPVLKITIPSGNSFSETLTAVGKTLLYLNGDTQLPMTYKITIPNLNEFEMHNIGLEIKGLSGTNDYIWRPKNERKIRILGLFVESEEKTQESNRSSKKTSKNKATTKAISYTDVYQQFKTIFREATQTDTPDAKVAQILSDKEIAKFLLDFMNRGSLSQEILDKLSLEATEATAIKQGLAHWLLLLTISEEQRTSGTYALVKVLLQDYATQENIQNSPFATPIKNDSEEKHMPKLKELLNPEKGLLIYMLSGGSSQNRALLGSPSFTASKTALSPETLVQQFKQQRTIHPNIQISPLASSHQTNEIPAASISAIEGIQEIKTTLNHQENIQALINEVSPKLKGKRLHAVAFRENAATNEMPPVKRKLVFTTSDCASSSHAMRHKRETCNTIFEENEVEANADIVEKSKQAVEFFQNTGKQLHAAFEIRDDQFVPRTGIDNQLAQSGLNAMYTIQMLMDINHKNHPTQKDNPIAQIITAHTYLGWAQTIQGSVQDIDHLTHHLQILSDPAFAESSSLFGRALGKLNPTLQGGAIVADIAELASAKTNEEKSQAALGLFFDSSGLLINGGAWAAETLFGAVSVSTVADILAAPIQGVMIGTMALATQFQAIRNGVERVGHFSDQFTQAYQKQCELKDNILSFPEGEVITKIDLLTKSIERDSAYIYPTSQAVAWGYWSIGNKNYDYIPWAGDMPRTEKNIAKAINLRQILGFPSEQFLQQTPNANGILILPTTPINYLTPYYNLLPGSTTTLHGHGFDVLREVEKKSDHFAFNFYCFPGERAIYKMDTEYTQTHVEILLDGNIKEIVVPKIPPILHGKMIYQMEGLPSTPYVVRLNEGVSFSFKQAEQAEWIFDTSQLNNDGISFHETQLRIGNIQMRDLAPSSKILVIQKNGNTMRVDMENKNIIPREIDEALITNPSNTLPEQLKVLSVAHKLDSFVILNHHQVNGNPVGRAFYETGRQRILYINDHDSHFSKNNIDMIVARDKDFFVQDLAHNLILHVDATPTENGISGQILHRYPPLLPERALKQTYTRGNLIFSEWKVGAENSETYYFDANQADETWTLSQINNTELAQQLLNTATLTPAIQAKLNELSSGNPQINRCADIVEIISTPPKGVQDRILRFWIDQNTNKIIKPNLLLPITSNDISSLSQVFAEPVDLLAIEHGKNTQTDTYYFSHHPSPLHHHSEQTMRHIYIQHNNEIATQIPLPSNSRIDILGNQLFVLHNNGTRQAITPNGLSPNLIQQVIFIPTKKTAVVNIGTQSNDGHDMTLPAIPGYQTLFINSEAGQILCIDQAVWDQYTTLYMEKLPTQIHIDIDANDWLTMKHTPHGLCIMDPATGKTLVLATSSAIPQEQETTNLANTAIQIGQYRPWQTTHTRTTPRHH